MPVNIFISYLNFLRTDVKAYFAIWKKENVFKKKRFWDEDVWYDHSQRDGLFAKLGKLSQSLKVYSGTILPPLRVQ